MFGTLLLYNGILLVSTFFIYLSEKERTAIGRALCTTIAFFIIFLPAAFRFEIGRDYFSYQRIFNQIADGIYSGDIESGYYFLNWLVASLGLSYEWLVGLVAFLIYFIAFLSYPKKNRAVFHFFFFVIFYFWSFNLLRSVIVSSLSLFACMRYMENNRKTQFIATILLASLFHISALLFIIFPFLNWRIIRGSLRIKPLVFISIGLFFLFTTEIIQFAFQSSLAEFMGFNKYGKNSYYAGQTEVNTGLGVLIKISLALTPLFFIKRINPFFTKQNLAILVSLACALTIIMAANIKIFGRLEQVFAIGYLLAIYIIANSPNIPHRWWLISLYILFNFMDFNRDILRGSTNYLETCRGRQITPYISVFNKEDSQRDPRYTWKIAHCEAHMGR